MTKYYYYVVLSEGGKHTACTCETEGEFHIAKAMELYKNESSKNCIILFWKEISKEEFLRLNEL